NMGKSIEEQYKKYINISENFYDRVKLLMEGMTKKKLKELAIDIVRINNIETTSLDFTLFMIPKGASRPRFSRLGGGRFYVPNASEMYSFFRKLSSEIMG